eukprot:gene6363-6856_t
MSFRIQSQRQKQIEYLQLQLQEHQTTLESLIEKISNDVEKDLEQKRREFVELLTSSIACVLPEQDPPLQNGEQPETFLYYIITLYLYSDDDLYNWFSLLKMNNFDQSLEETIFLKQKLLQSMDTGEGKSFKLEGMIALSIIGHRNLLHFLADFSFYKTLFYLMKRMEIDESVDDAGLFPHDLIKVTGFQQTLGELQQTEDKETVTSFMEQMLLLKKDHCEIRDLVHRYNQESREKEKQRLEKLHAQSIIDDENIDIPKNIQLADACVQSGQCPYQMNYLPPLHQTRITPPSNPPADTYVEVIIPNKIVLMHRYFSPEQCEAWMQDIKKVYDEGNFEAPNSLNRQGFKTKKTAMEMQVHSLVYFIAKEHGSSLGYAKTKTNYDSYHSFVITYDHSNLKDGSASLPKHVDSSLWTANLCLDAVEAENSVKFWLNQDVSAEQNQKKEDEENTKDRSNEATYLNRGNEIENPQNPYNFAIKLQTGDLLLHHGDIYHETSGPLKSENGHRTNIVIWYKEALKA